MAESSLPSACMLDSQPSPVWDGLAITHPVTSYCSQVTVSFDADRDQLPDPALYTECLQRSFEELRAAANYFDLKKG